MLYAQNIDRTATLAHFLTVKSLQEIEEAIAQLPPEARRQLVRDIPGLCPDAFPPDGWDAILRDGSPRPGLSSFLNDLDSEYSQSSEKFPVMNDQSLRGRK